MKVNQAVAERGQSEYYIIVDDYTLAVRMPEYLGYGGSLTVERTEGYRVYSDENNNPISDNGMAICLHIWPRPFVSYELGLTCMRDKTFGDEVTGQFEINEDWSLVNTEYMDDEEITKIEDMFAKHSEEIQHLFDLAEEVWGIS